MEIVDCDPVRGQFIDGNWRCSSTQWTMRSRLVLPGRVMRSWRNPKSKKMATVSLSYRLPPFPPLPFGCNLLSLTLPLTMSFYAASSTPTSTLTWISWFCSLPGHEYFCEVTEEFIEDDFNLTGLNNMVPFWKEAMEMVLDVDPGVDRTVSAGFARVMTSPRLCQMKMTPKYQMSLSWSHLRKCCMD